MSRLPPWTPFVQMEASITAAKMEALVAEVIRASGFKLKRTDVLAMMEDDRKDQEMWQNSRYTVLIFRHEVQGLGPDMIHLSIRRNDRQRPGPERYRDFQRIKTELVGPDNEGVELYPAEARVADCADQYHMYVMADPTLSFWFGYREGYRMGPQPGSVIAQSPFEEE